MHGDWLDSHELDGSTATFFAAGAFDAFGAAIFSIGASVLLIHAAVASWLRLRESFLHLFKFTMFDLWTSDPNTSESMRLRRSEDAVTSISGPSSSSAVDLAPPDDLRPVLDVAVVLGELRVELFSDFSGRLSNAKHSKLLDGSVRESEAMVVSVTRSK